jgi:two-component system, response regulator PdtaR
MVKVLVVEDEPLILMNFQMDLEDAGHQVFIAPNADIAMGILHFNDIGLLLTDIDMPGSMDGLELAKVARQRWPHIKIIVISGNRFNQPLPKATLFLSKPCPRDKLLKSIEAAPCN